MRKQKRYCNYRDFNDAINEAHVRVQELIAEADVLQAEANALMRGGMTADAAMRIKRIQTINESSIPRQELKLQKLKNALAEFRTETFSFASSNKGVVLK